MSVWMTVAQVAEQELVSARTVLRWIEHGDLRARRQPSGRLRIHIDWYRDLVDRGSDPRRILTSITHEMEGSP